MLRKTITGKDILEMIKKQLAEEGLTFKAIDVNDEFDFSDMVQIEVEVAIQQKPASSSPHYPPGVRTPLSGPSLGRSATPGILQPVGNDEGLHQKMERMRKRNEGTAYVQTKPSGLRSTFAAEKGENRTAIEDMEQPEDFRVGLTS
ncbi:hypothetical protein VPHD69_0086 [Vibrio phage D69]